MALNFDWINNDDLNGECFIAGEVGEVETRQAHRVVVFGPDTPAANAPLASVTFTNAQAAEFIALNVRYLAQAKGVPVNADHYKVAYVRLLAARLGLVSPSFLPDAFHVRYNEAERLDEEGVTAANAHANNAALNAIRLGTADRKKLRENFANMVCAVAYMFRVRGHHYLPEMETKYVNLWKKCLKGEDNPGLTWEVIAHDALHAIIPSVLDEFWQQNVLAGRIAGALIKRFDSAPAGVAAIRAVFAGSQDLQMAVPGIRNRFAEHFDDLDGIMRTLRANRWAGSINRRYYNAVAVEFDEQKFGAIASVVYHALEAFAANSPLLKSNALIRVANNAPITGGLVSRSIATAASDPALVKSMLMIN